MIVCVCVRVVIQNVKTLLLQLKAACHLSRNSKSVVECISSSLAGQTISSGLSIITSINSVLSSIATAGELGADEARDDINIVGRAMVEVALVNGSKSIGVATVSLRSKLNSRVGAVTKVKSGTLLGSCGGVASVLWIWTSVNETKYLTRLLHRKVAHSPCTSQSDTSISALPPLAAAAQALC